MIPTNLTEPRESDKERLLQAVCREGKRITVITGLSKNAGKTTFLNWLLERTPFSRKGIITTGRDGEDIDVLERIKKPKVSIPEAAIFSAGISEISRKAAYLHLLEKLPYRAGGKNIWLVRAETGLAGEITGPPTIKEQIDTARRILEHGADHVFIDGSLDRKAIGSAAEVDTLIVAGSPAYGSISNLRKGFAGLYELTRIEKLTDAVKVNIEQQLLDDELLKLIYLKEEKGFTPEIIPLSYKTLLGHEKEIIGSIDSQTGTRKEDKNREEERIFLYIPTSLTERSFLLLKDIFRERPGFRIIIKHPFQLHLDESSRNWLQERSLLLTIRGLEIAGFVINSYAVQGNHLDCRELRRAIRKDFPLPVVDIREMQ